MTRVLTTTTIRIRKCYVLSSEGRNGGMLLVIPTHRTCKKCNTTKLLSEFGIRRANPDNIDHICKACRRDNSRRYGSQWQQQEPWSTKEARKLLLIHHIPCVTGKAAGLPKIDLMAWACIPIEAKASSPRYTTKSGLCGFDFSFTRSQSSKGVPGLIILFTCYDNDRYRWFVIPGNSDRIVDRGHIHVTLDSPNSDMWKWLKEYENRLELIEHMRLQFLDTGTANEYRLPNRKRTESTKQ